MASDQAQQLASLIRALKGACGKYDTYVASGRASARLLHHSPHDALGAAQGEYGHLEREAQREARIAAAADLRAAANEQRKYNDNDRFAADILIRHGRIKSIDELEAWREQQNALDAKEAP